MSNSMDKKIKTPADKAVNILSRLVEIPSIKDKKNDEIINLIEKELKDINCLTQVDVANSEDVADNMNFCPLPEGVEKKQKYITGTIKGSGGGKSLLLFSHVDTESVVDRDLWNTNPFKLVKKSDKLYGLGTNDAKSGVAACIMALRVIKEMGIKLRGDVVALVQNEKFGGATGPLPVFTKECKVDGALYVHAPESANGLGEIEVGTKGLLSFKITIFGEKPALREAGIPYSYISIKDGVNAIDKAIEIIDALKKYAKIRDQKFNRKMEKTTFNIGIIKGGEASAVVADKCEIECSIVFSTKETIQSITKEINNVIQKTIKKDAFLKKCPPVFEIVDFRANPAYINLNDEILLKLKECIKEAGNYNLVDFNQHIGSVIRYPIICAKIPAISFGPKADNSYKPNEWVSEEQYIKSIEILVRFIMKWCK